ncbi:peroxiredoxin family protein [Hoylesella timonensis]|uniref:peroxiredoxin family protein n=1 Tax=Hoylesella timonensis TaxID=386414 RepID=UPI00336AC683
MKRIYITIFLSILMFTFSLVIYVWYHKEANLATESKLELGIVDINSRKVSEQIDYSKKTLLLFINTDCDYCLNEISYIKDNIFKFKNQYNLILISLESKSILRAFFDQEDLHSFFVVSDERCQIIDKYNVNGFPTLFLFSTKGIIIISHNGLAIDILKKLID